MKTALRQVDGEPFFRVIIIGQGDRMVINNCAHNKERSCLSSIGKANVMGERDRNDAWEAAERERLAKELVETVVRRKRSCVWVIRRNLAMRSCRICGQRRR